MFSMYSFGFGVQEITVIARKKLTGGADHWGVLLPDGSVVHNTDDRGVHIVSFKEFAAGRNVRVIRTVPWTQREATLERVQQELAARRPYHVVQNNCEAFANRVTGYADKSDQVNGLLLVAAAIGLTVLAANAR